ncbi:unnamed protein product [Mytilus edulis]|uniref:Uncharacterized protein n=1 Tax=Mytilus edulis TaxID=6550 RepID=A0A8S3RI06_MYTED|nr:unnamed protein product [Mytilus edulis]
MCWQNHQLASNATFTVPPNSEPTIVTDHGSDEAQIPNTTVPIVIIEHYDLMTCKHIYIDANMWKYTVVQPEDTSVNTRFNEHEFFVRSTNKEDQYYIKQRDTRQLKMKEAAINDEAKERTRLLDRLHKAESRHFEQDYKDHEQENRITWEPKQQ